MLKQLVATLATLATLTLHGVASADIIIGQTTGITGPSAQVVREITAGATMYLDAVNDKGGVNGQRVRLVSLDDKQLPATSAANARKLVLEEQAIALFLVRGTANGLAIMKELESLRVPLVAPSTGAEALHRPVHRWVFNVRSAYQSEAQALIRLLRTMGYTKIGIALRDDSYGEDVMAGLKAGLQEAKTAALFVARIDPKQPKFDELAKAVAGTQPQIVILAASAAEVVGAAKATRLAAAGTQLVTLSNNASDGFIKSMGDAGRGMIVGQVFPSERTMSYGFVREAAHLAQEKGIELSPAVLEGFAASKVLVEGLRRAGLRPTGAKLRDALESISVLDLGGISLGYSTDDHSGITYTDLSIITRDGHFRR